MPSQVSHGVEGGGWRRCPSGGFSLRGLPQSDDYVGRPALLLSLAWPGCLSSKHILSPRQTQNLRFFFLSSFPHSISVCFCRLIVYANPQNPFESLPKTPRLMFLHLTASCCFSRRECEPSWGLGQVSFRPSAPYSTPFARQAGHGVRPSPRAPGSGHMFLLQTLIVVPMTAARKAETTTPPPPLTVAFPSTGLCLVSGEEIRTSDAV